ncbi:translation initiation factor IF-2-like [Sciurus carolinensis]|uniref:translation initiation factor IF-2-like n=1 Tax=Sciurus carolinensis TaxID=30640 RepID=UPI001FB32425|nr:translation initiation factor IF-2-like [Sciurus carolinensis]
MAGGDPAQRCQRPGGEAEVSAGPEAPSENGSPAVRSPRAVPSPPRSSRAPGLWGPGGQGSQSAGQRRARVRPRARGVRVLRELRGGVAAGRSPAGGARPGPGCRAAGTAGPAVTGSGGRKGSHPSSRRLPSPSGRPAGSRGPAGGTPGLGAAGPLAGARAGRGRSRSSEAGLARRARRGLPASRGAAADILRRAGEGSGIATAAGKWRRGGSPGASLGGAVSAVAPGPPTPAWAGVPDVSVRFSASPPPGGPSLAFGSYLTTSRSPRRPPARLPFPGGELLCSFSPSPPSPEERGAQVTSPQSTGISLNC